MPVLETMRISLECAVTRNLVYLTSTLAGCKRQGSYFCSTIDDCTLTDEN